MIFSGCQHPLLCNSVHLIPYIFKIVLIIHGAISTKKTAVKYKKSLCNAENKIIYKVGSCTIIHFKKNCKHSDKFFSVLFSFALHSIKQHKYPFYFSLLFCLSHSFTIRIPD